jgi:hypothetical protein
MIELGVRGLLGPDATVAITSDALWLRADLNLARRSVPDRLYPRHDSVRWHRNLMLFASAPR